MPTDRPGPDALLRALSWRCIGPFRGGRVVAVAGDPADPAVFYFGACAGGVWKTGFFVQAGDGIRDVAVTGVQTCALPISLRESSRIFVELHLLGANMRFLDCGG